MTALKAMVAEVLEEAARGLSSGRCGPLVHVGVQLLGSEHGPAEVLAGARVAQAALPGVEVVAIGPAGDAAPLTVVEAADEDQGSAIMARMLEEGKLQAAVAMHHPFPLGVSTVGLVPTPGRGKPLFVACTTGMSAPQRVPAMVRNALYGLGVAKAWGLAQPSVGVLNLEGARTVEHILRSLASRGYSLRLVGSARADGETVLRGNDVLRGTPDVLVCDSLTGNVLMKMLSSFTTGGDYESVGFGYGPGVGAEGPGIVHIVSRASGSPVIANAIGYAVAMVRGNLPAVVRRELDAAREAGLEELCAPRTPAPAAPTVKAPARKVVSEQIPGIDVLDLERAQQLLWAADIYAETGMGCVGPVLLLAPEDRAAARRLLLENEMIGA